MTLSEIVTRVRRHAIAHGDATQTGDAAGTAIEADELSKAVAELRSVGVAGEQALLGLLNDPEVCVRMWAARHSLAFSEDRATQVLQELAQGRGLIAFSAGMVLREWKAGRLTP